MITMKKRSTQTVGDVPLNALIEVMQVLDQPGELHRFITDLCTPAELESMADRWRVVPLLMEGIAYREIHDRTGVSVTTIGRVARCLANEQGGYQQAVKKLKRKKLWVAPSKDV
jgi:TrpR-related protein YerC/YecD